jgi:multisubunit Na+/H+ antiporter MnhG subunit
LPPNQSELRGKKRMSRRLAGIEDRASVFSEMAMASLIGPAMVMVFCLSQAFRDVALGALFQGVDFFAVILLAFGISTLLFGAIALWRTPDEFRRLHGQLTTVLAMNVTTSIAWCCYFFALSHLEPAIVNTIHSGMAPLTVLAVAPFAPKLAKRGPIGRLEYACYLGIALSLAGLWRVVLAGQSGLAATGPATSLAALALLLVSGSSITLSLLYSKRLHDHGIGAATVTALRYGLILIVASVALLSGGATGISGAGQLVTIALGATLLVALPTFALQIGIARTAPLTAQIIRALGPVLIFALEQFDHRLVASLPTLVCIVAYSAFVIVGNFAHGWRDDPALSRARTIPRAP